MDAFLCYWKPSSIILLESELWPNLIMSSSARMSLKSFKFWSGFALPLISLMLSKFSLIVPLSTTQAIRYQLLQAPPFVINFAGDLKFVVEHKVAKANISSIEDLKEQLSNRHVWIAASIHRGEEQVMLGVHMSLVQRYPDLLTILVPRHPQHARELFEKLQKEGHHIVLRSQKKKITERDTIYMVDTLGELKELYSVAPVAVIGGSFCPGFAGHNVSEAAAAGCAVLTGVHVGHFSHMINQMQRLDPLSIVQVSGEAKLEEALMELFGNTNVLEARRTASKQAFHALSRGVIGNVWNLVNTRVLGPNLHGRT
ncbi:Probable 3-deoxy-D-manno-octulosonic acid transferase, mitochondrial [Linum perenne]